MQTRYCLLLTMDELRSLSSAVKQELAKFDPEFGNLVGVDPNAAPPQTINVNGVPTIPAVRNQPNQQSAADPVAAMPGVAPAQQMPPQQYAAVPQAAPIHTGAPNAASPGLPAAAPPMAQMPPGFPPQQQMPPGFPPAQPQQASSPVQPAQQTPPQQVPQQQQAVPQITTSMVHTSILPKLIPRIGSSSDVIALLDQAVQRNLLPNRNLLSMPDQNAGAFMQMVAEKMGVTVEAAIAMANQV